MKVLTWIALVLTVLGGLSVFSELMTGIDVETNVFALAYMVLLVSVLYPATKRR